MKSIRNKVRIRTSVAPLTMAMILLSKTRTAVQAFHAPPRRAIRDGCIGISTACSRKVSSSTHFPISYYQNERPESGVAFPSRTSCLASTPRMKRGPLYYGSKTTHNDMPGSSSKIDDFIYGAKATFRDGLFFKIQFISSVTYFATMGMTKFSSIFLPTPLNKLMTGFLQLLFDLGSVLMERFVFLTSTIPQFVLAALVVSLFYFLFYFLMTLERPRVILMQRLEILKEMTSRGETPMILTVLREGISIIQVCFIATFMEEITYRLFLPSAINNLFFFTQDKNGEEEQPKSRPRDNKRIVTICNVIFAIAHLESASVIAARRGHLFSQATRKFVLTFLLAQRVLAPAFQERGLMASWGAHVSFNSVGVALFTSLDYFADLCGNLLGCSSIVVQ
jgi:hypothetical protein